MKLSYILSTFALAAVLFSCKNEGIENPAVTTAQASYEMPAEGGELSLVFRSNMPWYITVTPGNAKSEVTDIRVVPAAGEASDRDITVTVKADRNEGAKRVAVISIIGTEFAGAVQLTQASVNAPAGPEAGTLSNPYKASALAQAVRGGDIPMGEVYVRGVVSQIDEVSGQYGNGTFWITDDGQESDDAFEIFRGKKFGGESYTYDDQDNPPFKVGDVVTVLGTATIYGNTPEFAAGSTLIAVNGLGGATGEGTEESPYSVAKAMEVTIAAGEDGTSESVYVKGIISEISEISTQYGNATWWISDDGYQPADNKTVLQVYRSYSFGGEKFTDAEALQPGDEVVVLARLVHYKSDTPETASGGRLVSVNGNKE